MMSRSYGALFASLSAAALLLSANDGFARPGATAAHGMAAAPSGAIARPQIGPGARFRGRNTPWVYWPGGGGFYDNAGYNQPFVDAGQPASTDVRYTYTYDVPGTGPIASRRMWCRPTGPMCRAARRSK